jgi:hypothetical protein
VKGPAPQAGALFKNPRSKEKTRILRSIDMQLILYEKGGYRKA